MPRIKNVYGLVEFSNNYIIKPINQNDNQIFNKSIETEQVQEIINTPKDELLQEIINITEEIHTQQNNNKDQQVEKLIQQIKLQINTQQPIKNKQNNHRKAWRK